MVCCIVRAIKIVIFGYLSIEIRNDLKINFRSILF